MDEILGFEDADLPELGPEWDALPAADEQTARERVGGSPHADLGAALAEAMGPMPQSARDRVVDLARVHYAKRPPRAAPAVWWMGGLVALLAAAAVLLARPAPEAVPYTATWGREAATRRDDQRPVKAVGCAPSPDAPRFVAGTGFAVEFTPARERARPGATVRVDGGAPLPLEIGARGTVKVTLEVGDPPLDLAVGWHCLTAEIDGAAPIALGFEVVPTP